MRNRNTSEDIRKIIDVMQYVKNSHTDALLISLDFEKVFDRVERTAVRETLKLLNFGDKLIHMNYVLCNNFQQCTMDSEHTSE